MKIDDFESVQEYIFDHHKTFGILPGEVESESGNVYDLESYINIHFIVADAAYLIASVNSIGDNPEYERGMAELISYNVWGTGEYVDRVLSLIHQAVHFLEL